jgi:hypothetical protein
MIQPTTLSGSSATFRSTTHFTTHRDRRVTREMIAIRTRELAARAGRIPPYVDQTDYEQAKRELTGESDSARQDAMINASS